MTTRQNNGRVTIAVLGTKLDTLTAVAQEIKKSQEAQREDIVNLQKDGVRFQGELNRTNDRISLWSGIQGAISAALAVVLGYIGTRQ